MVYNGLCRLLLGICSINISVSARAVCLTFRHDGDKFKTTRPFGVWCGRHLVYLHLIFSKRPLAARTNKTSAVEVAARTGGYLSASLNYINWFNKDFFQCKFIYTSRGCRYSRRRDDEQQMTLVFHEKCNQALSGAPPQAPRLLHSLAISYLVVLRRTSSSAANKPPLHSQASGELLSSYYFPFVS